MKLTEFKIRAIAKPGKYFDGNGLYLEVSAKGARYWRAKYRVAGKERRLALGVYPAVGLKAAREKHGAAREQLRAGVDPNALKKAAKVQAKYEAANTLEVVARDWLAHQAGRWSAVTLKRVTASLDTYIFPTLGRRALADLKPKDIRDAVKKIEAKGATDQAARVLQRVKAIYRYASTHDRVDQNPMADLLPTDVLKPRRVKHRPALEERQLPVFLEKLAAYEGDSNTVSALRLLMLTAVRPGELRGAAWGEIDTKAGLWRIPAARMKMKVEHVVPLSTQALALIETMRPLSGGGELIFPSPYYPSQGLSENTFNSALARMGYKGSATAHGFRALFSTVANEQGWDPDVIERQLAHVERNQVRAAYHRAAYLAERSRLMQWWADYIEGRRNEL